MYSENICAVGFIKREEEYSLLCTVAQGTCIPHHGQDPSQNEAKCEMWYFWFCSSKHKVTCATTTAIYIMYSVYQRVNALSSLLSSCVLGLLAVIALSSFVFPSDASGKVEIAPLKV